MAELKFSHSVSSSTLIKDITLQFKKNENK